MAIKKGECCALAGNPNIKNVQSMNIRARGRGEGIRVFLRSEKLWKKFFWTDGQFNVNAQD